MGLGLQLQRESRVLSGEQTWRDVASRLFFSRGPGRAELGAQHTWRCRPTPLGRSHGLQPTPLAAFWVLNTTAGLRRSGAATASAGLQRRVWRAGRGRQAGARGPPLCAPASRRRPIGRMGHHHCAPAERLHAASSQPARTALRYAAPRGSSTCPTCSAHAHAHAHARPRAPRAQPQRCATCQRSP
jgi:hypothetical protein